MSSSERTEELFREGHNCCAIACAERVALIVDGEAYFEAFMRAAERAERSILILAWDFDSRTALHFGPDGEPDVTLGEFLNRLAKRKRRLRIRILDWDYPVIYAHDREFPPLYRLSWKPHRRVHFHYDSTHPLAGSHHQKIVLIDDRIAFVGGLDLTSKRWDTREHLPGDPRRMAHGKPYPPFHDMMIAVDGAAARAISVIAYKRWHTATHEALKPVRTAGDPWPPSLPVDLSGVRVGIACTAPKYEREEEVRDVERLYLDMIARARRCIYIENQYFTAQRIGEALVQRLQQEEGPEIVLVTRLLSHGWLEEMTMHVLRTKLIRDLRSADRYGRFQVYYPDIEGLAEGTCIDVHSKTMVVDDEWLRIGSSNLSNRSMGLDTECDVVVEAQGDERVSRAIRAFRDGLIAEHLGVPATEVARALERHVTMQAAISELSSQRRGLKPLQDVPEWSDAVLSTVALADPERPVSLETLVQQFGPDLSARRSGPAWGKLAAAALVLVALTLAWRYTPLAELADAKTVIDWVQRFAGHSWAPMVVVLIYTPASLIMFPRPLITLAAVLAFGPWLGFVYSMTGILLATAAHYGAGRLLRRDTVRRLAGPRLNRMTSVLRRHGLLAMTALRLVPLAPFAVEGIVAGAIRLKFWHCMLGTFLGMLPGVLTATVFGDQLKAGLQDPSSINWWLVGGAVAVMLALTLWVRRWLGRLEAPEAHPGSRKKRPAAVPAAGGSAWLPARLRTLLAIGHPVEQPPSEEQR
jgi:phosphatidylserine/phosphatidylglycerophosphate/cardiolipin synthase-like enzyme/uncharacterized membrane protein YdjX (TVP38/TMEM64 family)